MKLDIKINLEAIWEQMKIKVHNARSDGNQSTSKVKVNTNLWIPPCYHICLMFNTLAHIIGHGSRKSPFYAATKSGRLGHVCERAVIGHFQKARLVGKLEHGCLVCCQTLDNLIRDLIR